MTNGSDKKLRRLAVNEIFGPTIQGEGFNLGMPTMFLRLAGCNQHCVWCDTPYTWDWTGRNGVVYNPAEEVRVIEWPEVAYQLRHRSDGKHNLVVSGGEPLLQQVALQPLCEALREEGWWVEMETAGSIFPALNDLVDLYTVSPKLSSSKNEDNIRLHDQALKKFSLLAREGKAVFKFVVAHEKDLNEVDELVTQYQLSPVYLMPEGKDAYSVQSHLNDLVDFAIQKNYRLTTRLQIVLYGNRRGV